MIFSSRLIHSLFVLVTKDYCPELDVSTELNPEDGAGGISPFSDISFLVFYESANNYECVPYKLNLLQVPVDITQSVFDLTMKLDSDR